MPNPLYFGTTYTVTANYEVVDNVSGTTLATYGPQPFITQFALIECNDCFAMAGLAAGATILAALLLY